MFLLEKRGALEKRKRKMPLPVKMSKNNNYIVPGKYMCSRR